MVNPLIDEIFILLFTRPKWEVHTLTCTLIKTGHLTQLDDTPQKNIFKRNFLVMNGLYQLQTQLAPEQHLKIAALHIELINKQNNHTLERQDPLRDYYLDWKNFDTSSAEIDALLANFWQRFISLNRKNTSFLLPKHQLLQLQQAWQLPTNFSLKELQKRWRQLALQHHPDRQGCVTQFKRIQLEYEQLKAHCS